ncbi:hypothetical protein ACVWZ7_000407 [Arthrobacter sp. TE12232]
MGCTHRFERGTNMAMPPYIAQLRQKVSALVEK